ncbi:MAG: hypoxanthine phosphoribosyltransferase [Prevotellaceae bacterium]|jgi:hypoxanthine phosphoribosyltransferase|nr:hypoxanthine phosphoribosyltransferase [Prevotellaceae bacterium]
MKKRIKLHDKEFEIYIPYSEMSKIIENVAVQINYDMKNESAPVFISVLNGAFMFTADLLKNIDFPCEVSFVKLKSYQGTESSGTMNQLIGLNQNLAGRTVILLEDIVDTGSTLEFLLTSIQKHKPRQIKIATMLYKPDSYKKNISLDYIGLHIPNKFVVGYGLDYNELGRNLHDIYTLTQ